MSGLPLGVVDDASFDQHRADGRHPECPERLAAARAGLRAALDGDPAVSIAARPITDTEVARVHAPGHLGRILSLLDAGVREIDADTYAGPGTKEAMLRAAGGAAELGAALARGTVRRGVALVRPPGHHAEADRAMGFCLLNNVALAASAALDAGAQRVAIVDWDVHHGNGTQDIFARDGRVFFSSLHQWPLYPGTGAPDEVGFGAGAGHTANLALPPGSGPAEYAHAFRTVLVPVLEAFRPDLVLVSAGFDAHAADPLASMELDESSYGGMTTALVDLAERLGHGKVGLVLEGGYDLAALEASLRASLRALRGTSASLSEDRASGAARTAIEHTRSALEHHWPGLG